MSDLESKVKQLADMGFSESAARKLIKDKPTLDMSEVIALLVDQPGAMSDSPPPLVSSVPDSPPTAAAKAPTPPLTADEELERVMKMSLQEHEDRQRFDEEIKGGTGYKDPENPFDRKRASMDLPAGIANKGNTCYINSLLQSFFMYPEFRQRIFDVDTSGAADSQGCKLVHELQLLFSRMLLTERKYVDPSPLLEFTSHHGAQEDPTELFLSLLEKMREGVMKRPNKSQKMDGGDAEDGNGPVPMDLGEDGDDQASSSPGGNTDDLISHYFEGTLQQSVEASEQNGDVFRNETREQFQQIICSIPMGNDLLLHDLLELYTGSSEIDGYVTPLEHVTQARKGVWFEQLPPILTIQLQRVAWINNALQKNNTKVVFDQIMYMDRYLAANQGPTLKMREHVAFLKKRLAELCEKRQQLTRYNGTDLSILDILGHTCHFLEEQESSEAQAVCGKLDGFVAQCQQRLKALDDEITALQYQISSAYDSFPTDNKYHLHAILVHSGSPDLGGHYWSYIVDHGSGSTWWKFNDVTVSEVPDFAEIAAQSFGDSAGATSAYALVYIRDPAQQPWNDRHGMPEWAERMVIADNDAFHTELENWRISHPEELTNDEKLAQLGRKKRELNDSAGSVDIMNASSLAKYGLVRGVSPRLLDLLLAEEMHAVLPEPASDAELKTVSSFKSDFEAFCRSMWLFHLGLSSMYGSKGKSEWALCAAYFAKGLEVSSAQVLTQEFHALLLKALETALRKSLFSFSVSLKGMSGSDADAKLRTGLNLWSATLRLPVETRRDIIRTWKDLLPDLTGPLNQLKHLIEKDEAPPKFDPAERDGAQEEIEAITDQFSLLWAQLLSCV